MNTPEPPAAESGIKYETVDARCEACVVKGGTEAKCVSKAWEEVIGDHLGKVCPRVELMPELHPVAEVLEFALNEKLRPALGLRAELIGESYAMTSEDLNDVLSLVSATVSHPDVVAILNPKPVEN